MTAPLSTSQLTNLRSILDNPSLTTDQRVASYYQTLGSYGYAYGNLAYGVATNSTPDGQIANAFTANYAAEHGIPYNAAIASAIRIELARQDIDARIDALGNDLSGYTIRRYHERVYSALANPLPINAWASEVPIQLFGEEGWQAIMAGVGGDALVGVGVALIVFTFATHGIELGTAAIAANWLGDISAAVAAAGVGTINSLIQSSPITAPDGSVFTITPNGTSPDTKALQPTLGGQSYFYDRSSGLSVYVSSAALNGEERSYVSNASGLLEFEARSQAGSGVLEFPDGTRIDTQLPSFANVRLASLSSDGGAPIDALTNYLSQIGHPVNTIAEIGQLHLDQLHPAVGTFTFHPIVGALRSDGKVSVDNLLQVNANRTGSGNLTGQATAVVYNQASGMYVTAQAFNILDVSGSQSLGRFSQYTLTHF